jgi:protein involved in polysaccharide export with SLBB domain
MQRGLSWIARVLAFALLLGGRAGTAKETVVTSGDTVRITVAGEPSLSQAYSVNSEGKITLPNVGAVEVKGLSAGQIEQKLVGVLSRYYRSPSVMVELAASAADEAAVYGAVKQPGALALKPGDRLLDLIARAGGLLPNADREKATLMRSGRGATDRLALPLALDLDAVYKGDLSQNIEVRSGDTLLIPEQTAGKIKVMGEVTNSPTEILFRPDLSLAEAIGFAGSFKPSADRTRVRVIHRDLTETEVNLDDPRVIQTTKLSEGDVVFVPNNEENQFSILGGVANPGKYPIKPGMTVTDAIATAGGFKDSSRVKRNEIRVARALAPPIVLDLDRYFRGDVTQNVRLQRGDTIFIDEKGSPSPRGRRTLGSVISGLLLPAATLLYYLNR